MGKLYLFTFYQRENLRLTVREIGVEDLPGVRRGDDAVVWRGCRSLCHVDLVVSTSRRCERASSRRSERRLSTPVHSAVNITTSRSSSPDELLQELATRTLGRS